MSVNVTVEVYTDTGSNLRRDGNIDSKLQSLMCDSIHLNFQYPDTTIFEKVLFDSAQACGIVPLYFSLFALRDVGTGFWINPRLLLGDYITAFGFAATSYAEGNLLKDTACKTIKVELRIRFLLGNEFCSRNDKVIAYLFHQYHADFLKGKLKMNNSCPRKLDDAMTVAGLDILRLAAEAKCELHFVKNHLKFSTLFPPDCLTSFTSRNWLNRWKVDYKLKSYIKKIEDETQERSTLENNVTYFYCTYLHHLKKVLESLDEEKFKRVTNFDTLEEYTQIIIGASSGVVKEDNTGKHEEFCHFHEIADVSIHEQQNSDQRNIWMIKLSLLNGKLLNLCLPSELDAENIVSCIDGYCQLLSDTNHYLCEKVASPSLVERLACKCYGPISNSYADTLVKKQSHLLKGACLLRQSWDSYGEYFVNVVEQVTPHVEIKTYKLDRDHDGNLGVCGYHPSHVYNNLTSLIEAITLKKVVFPFQESLVVHPYDKDMSILTMCNYSSVSIGDEDNHHDHSSLQISTNDTTQETPDSHAELFIEKDYQFVRLLGAGKFSSVQLQCNKTDKKRKIVLKTISYVEEHGESQYVDELVNWLTFVKHAYIIRQMGTMKNMIVLEYAPLGSITLYFEQLKGSTDHLKHSSWLLSVLWQLAHACNYLEVKEYPHGNIRGKNVLLVCDSPRPRIKLGDPGIHTCNAMIEDQLIPQPVLPAPWLAYEFCRVGLRYSQKWKPTISGDKWSFATTACEICGFESYSVEKRIPYNLNGNMKERYKTSNVPVIKIPQALNDNSVRKVKNLIEQCYNRNPTNRPRFKLILRELGAVQTSNYVINVPENVGKNSTPINLPDIVTYQDQFLVPMGSLGSGNYGDVQLCCYTCGKGRTEELAVKSLKQKNVSSMSREFNSEIETMLSINHQYVVKLKGVAEPSLRIVMEYVEKGSLYSYLRRHIQVPLQDLFERLLRFCTQISQGMLALQEKNIVHRDLALRNILLANDSCGSEYIKISDFGLSRMLSKSTAKYLGKPDQFPAQWYAPECLQNEGCDSFGFASDVWSFGVTMWEIFSYGKSPNIAFKKVTQFLKLLKSGKRLSKPSECPIEVYNLMNDCWKYEPKDRKCFRELIEDLKNMHSECINKSCKFDFSH